MKLIKKRFKIDIMNNFKINIGFFFAIMLLFSCNEYEYMPDMYRSPSIQPNEENNIKNYNSLPVENTIARGDITTFPYSSSVNDYIIAGNEATFPTNFIKNEKTLEQGKSLYAQMCAHCHGKTGKGDGPVGLAAPSFNDTVQLRSRILQYDSNGDPIFFTQTMAPFKRSLDSSNELDQQYVDVKEYKEGHIFHTITYGHNSMGPHASFVSEEERWKIVYFVMEKLR